MFHPAKPSIHALVLETEKAREGLLGHYEGLSAAEAHTPVGEGRWSPVQYLEHLVRAEEATVWRMFGSVADHRAGRPVSDSPTPDASIEELVDRTWPSKVEAPPFAVPTWTRPSAYWVLCMRRNAALVTGFADFVSESELDSVAYNHPISGPFTLRQGMEFIRFHMDRHLGHVREAGAS